VELLPLGDQAALVRFPDEATALSFADAARQARPDWLVDAVVAYTSVGVFYDPERAHFAEVCKALGALAQHLPELKKSPQRTRVIPCCYEFALDLERVAKHTGLDAERVITLHAAALYTVYAIGFCPGFPYLGYLDPALAGVPRLASPRTRVEVGSVGMTGRQTGVYSEARPGGWNLIGRTPLALVNV